MRTAPALTISPSMHFARGGEGLSAPGQMSAPRGGVCSRGVHLVPGGVYSRGCLLQGVGVCLLWGVYLVPGGWGCLFPGVYLVLGGCLLPGGVCSRGGCLLPGGVCSWGGGYLVPGGTWSGTPPCGQTHACKHITLPQTSFAGGNKAISILAHSNLPTPRPTHSQPISSPTGILCRC